MKSKFDDPDVEDNIVELLKIAKIPVSIDYVAHHMKVGWDTARAALLNLALQGKIKANKTTKSLIFFLGDDELQETKK